MRGGFADFGILTESDVRVAESPDHRFTSVFHGRFAANIDQLRAVSDLMPGTSGSDTERQMFGSVRPDVPDHPSRRRYPVIALKMPTRITVLPRRLRRSRGQTEAWWRHATATAATGSATEAQELLADAARRFENIMRVHVAATMWASALYAQLTALTGSAGCPGSEAALVSGYGGMEETESINELWQLSRGRLTMAEFLNGHGYHAPVEAELMSQAWREDPSPVQQRSKTYRRKDDSCSPALLAQAQRQTRLDTERRVLDGLPAHRRPAAHVLMRLARRYIPLRETGKAAFLQTIDVARAAARALGQHWHRDGTLSDPDGIFFLTMHEVAATPTTDLRSLVKGRRDTYAEYQSLQLPDWWIGSPTPLQADIAETTEVTGIAVSSGVVEGLARVMTGPDSGDLEDGEILVCNVTGPSWASFVLRRQRPGDRHRRANEPRGHRRPRDGHPVRDQHSKRHTSHSHRRQAAGRRVHRNCSNPAPNTPSRHHPGRQWIAMQWRWRSTRPAQRPTRRRAA
jgi:pyruvate,water dikinase